MEKNEEETNTTNDHSMEILASLDFFQGVIEGTFIFNEIKATAIDVGTKLSHFLVEYFLMIWPAKWTVIESMIQAVKDVIQSESLEEKKWGGAKKDVIQKANVSHNKSENDLLGMIFSEILNFEIAFCRPIFSMPSADRVLLLAMEKYTRQLLASKMGNIRSYMSKLEEESSSTSDRDPRKKKLKEKLNVGIGNLWKNLEL